MQLKVTNSPFNQEQTELLNKLLPTLSEAQKLWLSGYFAAVQFAAADGAMEGQANPAAAAPARSREVTILYGSQTGNAQSLAKRAGKTLEGNGFKAVVSSMSDFKTNNLKKIENLLILVSTHGEGDPPDNALSFHEFLNGRRAPKLEGVNYSVLSLGDSSYEFFCQTGKEFDIRLEELGATRIYPRVDCDVDFDEPAAEWIEGILNSLNELGGENPRPQAGAAAEAAESAYSRTNPFKAEVLENINLNGRGSNKETRHIELSLEDSGLTYKPGDSLGIYPENDPALVGEILDTLPWDPEIKVTVNNQRGPLTLKEALTVYFEITVLTKPLLEKAAKLSANQELHDLAAPDNKEKLNSYLYGRDLLNLVSDFGVWGNSAGEFVSVLRKIPPRLYSIASSLAANPDEVHLTIGTVRYEAHERERKGVCSTLCAERINLGDTLSVFIQQNDNFKMPDNPETPIIMVGPGTGVAPFRAFMQEREESGFPGKSWLFFGDQHFVTDFLYQTEWQRWMKEGVLTKMDVAFSRDSAEKVYVQHRMLENSNELFKWLEEGAVVYICGDEKNMAHDVQKALIKIIETEGGMSLEQAEAYLAGMQQQKRYQRDVY
ncbi:assimilatory sulfite reductase (NADPH) flavoprotein subunit [Bacillus sp. ISL-39]|uniref:assimilatory sulfite reductase (NADPH) flavoprotein subunit n=1 Tax=Bacillus sp. ISL-39 TaxID=2819124 RepID=UPI001BEBBBF5|nr:assimilatory sulfite reductase (NADPH) flavoprotein subunit [Bacillus sp. ISL-39]MBT2640011.1 assimilatory sulfite reductase (NADPH) flavoprotein subunit [Bacillus sp. ISL-39]